MGSIDPSELGLISNVSRETLQENYNLYLIGNAQIEYLFISNVLFSLLLKFSPLIDKKIEKYNETIELPREIFGIKKFRVLPRTRSIALSVLFLSNFAFLVSYYGVSIL